MGLGILRAPVRARTKLTAWAAAALLLGAVAAAGSAAARPETASTEGAALVGPETQFVGCVIRLDPKRGPYLHHNSTHTCVGVTKLRITPNGHIQLHYPYKGRTSSVAAVADETIAMRGILVGADSRSTYATFSLYDTKRKRRLNLANPSDYKLAAGTNSNVWFAAVREAM